jgi:hypothetical protein
MKIFHQFCVAFLLCVFIDVASGAYSLSQYGSMALTVLQATAITCCVVAIALLWRKRYKAATVPIACVACMAVLMLDGFVLVCAIIVALFILANMRGAATMFILVQIIYLGLSMAHQIN